MRAFIIRPFGVKQGIDFNRVADSLIGPALAELRVAGRDTIEILKQGNIRIDMFQLLLTADLVVADLSIHNANVFYELGIRHALRSKRTFLLRSNQDAYPFDLQTDRYFTYDPEKPAASLPQLVAALRQTLASESADSPVFALLPDLQEQGRAQFLAVPRGFREEVGIAVAARHAGDLGLLAAEAEGFAWESEGLRIVGRAQYELKDRRGARATWEKIRHLDEDDLEANTLLGTIYQRLDDLPRSDQALQRVLARKTLKASQRAEANALLGRNAKTRWKNDWQAEPPETPRERQIRALRSPFLAHSGEAYFRGFAADLNHFYSGLNALAMESILVALARALPEVWSERFDDSREAASALDERQRRQETLAAAVGLSIAGEQARLEREGRTDVWAEVSAADLRFLTSKRPPRVADAYRNALAGAADFTVEAVRDQLCLYRDLDLFTENVAAALAACGPVQPAASPRDTRILLFTGHMIDAAGRQRPRFPPDKEAVARAAIRSAIERELGRPGGVAGGIAGGASGGDILFHELCAELGIPTRLFLALPRGQFIEESVRPAGGNWRERFDRLIERLPTRVLAEEQELPSWLAERPEYNIWQRSNLWMLHNALAEAREDVSLIALWNGEQGDGPGGTGDLVARARQRHAEVTVLDTKALFGTA
jgi:hypothetical protein